MNFDDVRPGCGPATPDPLRLNFQVSTNEEHAYLRIGLGTQMEIDLGERVHHYSLLTLARLRLEDAARGIDPSSQGWVRMSQLARMLGLDATCLNIQIFRARKQIAGAAPHGLRLPDIVERRRGELRVAAAHIRIVRGSRLEGEAELTEPAVMACNAL